MALSSRQKGHGQHAAIWVQSCYWLTQFLKVIWLELSLVRISVTKTFVEAKKSVGLKKGPLAFPVSGEEISNFFYN